MMKARGGGVIEESVSNEVTKGFFGIFTKLIYSFNIQLAFPFSFRPLSSKGQWLPQGRIDSIR